MMGKPMRPFSQPLGWALCTGAALFLTSNLNAQPAASDLGDGLVAYWPLDSVEGDKTPDRVHGYNLAPYFGASHTLTNGNAITLVAGKKGKAVSFADMNQVLLAYTAAATDDLPINKNPA